MFNCSGNKQSDPWGRVVRYSRFVACAGGAGRTEITVRGQPLDELQGAKRVRARGQRKQHAAWSVLSTSAAWLRLPCAASRRAAGTVDSWHRFASIPCERSIAGVGMRDDGLNKRETASAGRSVELCGMKTMDALLSRHGPSRGRAEPGCGLPDRASASAAPAVPASKTPGGKELSWRNLPTRIITRAALCMTNRPSTSGSPLRDIFTRAVCASSGPLGAADRCALDGVWTFDTV